MRLLAGLCVATITGSAAMAGQAVLTAGAALRSGPDPLYEAVTSAGAGTLVDAIEGTVGWTLVRLPNGAKGWVQDGYLASPGTVVATAAPEPATVPASEAEPVTPFTSVVWPNSGRLNLRTGPGTTYDVVQPMNRGDWVSVTAEAGAWVKVVHESGQTGWTYRDYLTR